MDKIKILIVDDEPLLRKSLFDWLKEKGYGVFMAGNGKDGIKTIKREKIDMAFVDLKLPDINGIEVMNVFKNIYPEVVVIIITAFASVQSAVEAMKEGAYDYLVKPFSLKEVDFTVKKVIERQKLIAENTYLKQQLKQQYKLGEIFWESPKMKQILECVETVSQSNVTVLIQGASGTGKEVLARTIHFRSLRRDKPFVTVNCAAIPEALLESELFGHEKGAFTGANNKKVGRFEIANEGTLFLDEVGIMGFNAQVDLLRVLQEKEFRRVGGSDVIPTDVRIIAATNMELKKAVSEGKFREDLYYRLNVVSIDLPPLKDRKKDIPSLARHFIQMYCSKEKKKVKSISNEALRLILKYDWPGNIRELENVIERAVVLSAGNTIVEQDLPEVIQDVAYKQGFLKSPSDESLDTLEKIHILAVFKKHDRNITKTAIALKIDRGTLYKKLRKYKTMGILPN